MSTELPSDVYNSLEDNGLVILKPLRPRPGSLGSLKARKMSSWRSSLIFGLLCRESWVPGGLRVAVLRSGLLLLSRVVRQRQGFWALLRCCELRCR